MITSLLIHFNVYICKHVYIDLVMRMMYNVNVGLHVDSGAKVPDFC